MFIQVMNLFIV